VTNAVSRKQTFPGADLAFRHRLQYFDDPFGYSELMELIFEIRDAEEGGFFARSLGPAIFTEGETWEELRANVLEAVGLHYENRVDRPRLVQLHYVKDELIAFEAA
jgi:predicted RNase H-like HicB family nuclease